MRKFILVLLFPALLFGGKQSVQYDTATHKVTKPPVVGAMPDYDYTGLTVIGLGGGTGGGGTPGGADRQMQFNNAFTFGGTPYLLFTGSAITQQVGARYQFIDPTDNTKRVQISLLNSTGTLKTVTITDDSVTVIPNLRTPNQFVTYIGVTGFVTTEQPLFSNLGGTLNLTSQTTMNTGRILGRTTPGNGAIEEIAAGTNITIAGGTISAAGGGGGTPGGIDTQFQYNNASAFGGTANLVLSGGQVKAVDANFLLKNISDPTKQLNFNLAGISTATTVTAIVPPGTTAPVLVKPDVGAASNFLTGIGSTGIVTKAQPNFTDIAGTLGLAQQNFPIAKERFVDPVNGSDISGAENLAKPFLTIAGACVTATSGTVIYLYPNLTGYNQGTSSLVIPAGVTIVGAGPDTTVITGAVTGLTRGVVEPSTASAIYNVTMSNTSSTGFAFGVGSSSAAFTSAYVGGCKISGNAQGIYLNKAGSTGLVVENSNVSTQNDAFFQNVATAVTSMRNCEFVADGTTTLTESKGLNVTNGAVRFNYGNLTVGGATGTNVGAFGSGSGTTIELHGVRISNSLGGATNYDMQAQSSAIVGKDNVYRPDAGPIVTNGTVTELSRYAVIDNNLSDFPNLGAGTRGDIIFRNATGWTKLAAGLDGNVLTTHGNTADPNWLTVSGSGGIVDNAVYGPAWAGITTSAPGKDTIYNYLHLMDSDDNGKINVLDQVAGIVNTNAAGVIQTPLAIPATVLVGDTAVQTLTNKRVTKRQNAAVAPTPAPVIDTDSFDVVHYTGITSNFTSISASGTPTSNQTLVFDFTDDGTPRTIAWDAFRFEASPGQVLPTTTTAGTRLDVGFRYNIVTGKWRCLASSNPATGGAGTGTVTSVGISGANGITVTGSPVTTSGTLALALPITLAGTAGKTLTVNGNVTLTGNTTLDVGPGGILGANAFNSTAFLTSAAISDAVFGSAWNGDTTTAGSRNSIYDEIHAFDTDDNGKVNVLDLTTAELVKTNTSGVVSSAVGGTDYTNLAFKTVSVAGQSDVVADTAGDVLTLAAGSNVTLTTTPGTDTVTIAATGGAGGTPGNPTASVGLTAVNGSATTYMRSDAAPALSQSIVPTWTGKHIWDIGSTVASSASAKLNDLRLAAEFITITGTTHITTADGFNKMSIEQQSYTGTGPVTVDYGATLYIAGAPSASGGVTLTNPYALWVDSGLVRFDGGLAVGTTSSPAAGVIDVSTGYKINGTTVGVPGGSNTQVQYNNSGAFAGNSGLTFDSATGNLSVGGQIRPGGGDLTVYFVEIVSQSSGMRFDANNLSPMWLTSSRLNLVSGSLYSWNGNTTDPTAAPDTAIGRNAAGVVEINNGTLGTYRDLICRNITISGGNFTGRINPRASGGCDETTSTTSTPTADSCDQWDVTALAATTDTFAAPTGTPVNAQNLTIRIKDNGTARTLAWNAIYRPIIAAIPTTTVISKTLYLGFKYNAADSKWDLLAIAQEP